MLENVRVAVQGLYDRQPDGMNILECFLGRGLAARGVLLELPYELLEALIRLQPLLPSLGVGLLPLGVGLLPLGVGLPSLRVGLPTLLPGLLAIGSHFGAEVTELFQH